MQLSDAGINFIKQWEAFRGRPYNDGYGTVTIGYGHAIKAGESFTSLTESEAAALLAQDAAWAEDAVNRRVYVPLTQSMFDALTSLVFNWGEGNFSKSSLLSILNSGDYLTAAASLGKYPVTSKGIFSQGLANRRAAESDLFLREGLPSGTALVSPVDQAPSGDEYTVFLPSLEASDNSLLPLLALGVGIVALVLLD